MHLSPRNAIASHTELKQDHQQQEELFQDARQLAERHASASQPPERGTGRAFLSRLRQYDQLLEQAHTRFLLASQHDAVLSYAAEWYLDNYYLLQRIYTQVQEDFTATYYWELPKLGGDGSLSGYPRVFDIARQFVVSKGCEVDTAQVRRFLQEYQQVQPLRIGELWAFPIMLRIVLLEAIVQAAEAPPADEESQQQAAAVAPPPFTLPLEIPAEDVIATCIPSLRVLLNENWKAFFESVSPVDRILRSEPAQLYSLMDFETRDRYRKRIERLAAHSSAEEVAVAQQAVKLSEAHHTHTATAHSDPDGAREPNLDAALQAHVGYYLIDEGRKQLAAQIGYRPDLRMRLAGFVQERPTLVYLGAIALGVTAALALTVLYLQRFNGSAFITILALALMLVPAITVVTGLINWAVTRLATPKPLPKLDFSEAIPASCRSFVVIPSMLGDIGEIDSLLRQLEGHYLRNPDPQLRFALLTDFTDAAQETTEKDAMLVQAAREGVMALNSLHRHAPFYLFHRRRLLNEREGIWMGWERKRGKLHEFNRLLRGADDTTFNVQVGDKASIGNVRYVITLDADTILPQDSAATLVGAMAHPLNQPRFDARSANVVGGYTVLQPRAEIQPPWDRQSLFTRVFAGDTGLDLYSRAVSDVYQDLFSEGIYVGKGIYHVDAFERSLQGWVPENSLLSHDLFEGLHGRAGLITDVTLYEDYPPHYLSQVRRTHRWVRGDWQLLPWLLPFVPTHDGWQRNRLALIDLWKIADNLRRSLLSPSLLVLLFAGWTVLPGSPLLWTALALLTPAVPLLTGLLNSLMRLAAGEQGGIWRRLRDSLVRWLLYIAFLPYEALLNLDAIVTTLLRLLVTRRNLLQWTTASHTARIFGDDVSADLAWQNMFSAFVVSGVLALALFLINPDIAGEAGVVVIPLLLLWALSPELAYFISRPEEQQVSELSEQVSLRLRRLARRTWFFFERFVGPEDNWLPPDNYQEEPKGIIAHRTSPTNIGLYLLSAVAAYDFGYIDATTLMLRLRSSFNAFERLERYRGHFLNWYATNTLAPLPPRYVSTVDSGNLAASLVALKQALRDLPRQPAIRQARWTGFADTVGMLLESLAEHVAERDLQPLLTHYETLREQIDLAREAPVEWLALLDQVQAHWFPQMERLLLAVVDAVPDSISPESLQDWRVFIERSTEHLQNMRREYDLLAPWLTALRQPPTLFTTPHSPPILGDAWQALNAAFGQMPVLHDASATMVTGRKALGDIKALLQAGETPTGAAAEQAQQALAWIERFDEALEAALMLSHSIAAGCEEMAAQAEAYLEQMDFRFLYHRQRQVFHIGYNLDTGALDENYYDLLASEARMSSLVAIAKNDVPSRHWLYLSRPITSVGGKRTLLSWSGTMFEYLMPPLLLPRYRDTLLDSSSRNAIQQQIAHGRAHNMPWGISESGFYSFDSAMNYQYRAFGVPGLGFKRGLGEDLVVSPYASLLALPFNPEEVLSNLDRLNEIGMKGRYGYYEAVDFTESRLPPGRTAAIVCSYMAHHQGMIMLALSNFLDDNRMVRRFHSDARIQSVDLLLQEQAPLSAPLETPHQDALTVAAPERIRVPTHAWPVPLRTPMPAVHFLSNGSYRLLFTNNGGGYSQWKETALTRWRPDTTLDDWGQWLYIEDRDRHARWSAMTLPTEPASSGELTLSYFPHKVQWRRRDHDIVLQADIFVPPEDDVELRRFRITNDSSEQRRLRLTHYTEIVLGDEATDLRHQTFSKLFVASEFLPEQKALLFRRRPRSAHEQETLMAQTLFLASDDAANAAVRQTEVHYESDRLRFVGRNRNLQDPLALESEQWLTGTTGPTLDPVSALGAELVIAPYSTVELALITVVGDSRQEIETLLARYRSASTIHRSEELARTRTEHELQRLDLGSPALEQGQKLLSLLLYPHPARRVEHEELARNQKGQAGLWAYGISGDYPILLLSLHDESESAMLQELLRLHGYWYKRGLKIDLVILNDQESNYGQLLQNFIFRVIRRAGATERLQRRGGIFIVSRDQVGDGDLHLLQAAARVWLEGAHGSLEQQLANLYELPTRLPALEATREPTASTADTALPRPDNLIFDNGYGGFSADGKEYVIYSAPGSQTPAPWINVIANPQLGFVVSESGGGFSWRENSGENRLTSWRNDPVRDQPSEALYLRDEETAEIWSPMPQPAPAAAPYLTRHGAGYTIFEHSSHELKQETELFVAPDAPVKVVRLRVQNLSPRQRRLTATYYAEWVLGTTRATTQQYLIPEYVAECHALLVRNPYSAEFAEAVAFLGATREPHGITADRTEFLGRLGSLRRPAALQRIGLENAVRAGADPCAALQLHIDLAPGAEETVTFILGQGANRQQSLQLLQRFHSEEALTAASLEARRVWDDILGVVQVQTPDRAMDFLLNRWLLYQALSCRIWGRSALYQSSGAYGFRDQLQDVMALMHARPDLAREHILRAARHQFEEGDVLHWWHPPSGRGVRTRISDDLLWLPFVTAYYVEASGDAAILDEKVPFLSGKGLAEHEEERYGHYAATAECYSILEHCVRALYRGMTRGRHDLPLIGGGDWNDGMNRVGIEGQGESVWLGWFLCDTLQRFATLCRQVGRDDYADAFLSEAQAFEQALENGGWDGDWYRRAYYDDGSPLGSRQSDECQIDAIAQSWSVLSGAGQPARQQQAMAAVEQRLVDAEARLLRLFTPPFDKTPKDPGYIKGYPPGIRENGGQYTHAALWTIWAFAHMGQGQRAESLFRLINPVYHAQTKPAADHYKVEPYVVAADVYGAPPHIGRGGWTWYTGSSGWMYRLGLEAILGLKREGQFLRCQPAIPPQWPGFKITYRHGQTIYHITVRNDGQDAGDAAVSLDGNPLPDGRIPLQDGGGEHHVQIHLGA